MGIETLVGGLESYVRHVVVSVFSHCTIFFADTTKRNVDITILS